MGVAFRRSAPTPLAVQVAIGAIVAGIAVTLLHALVPFRGVGETIVEVWVFVGVELTAAVLCAARAVVARPQRAINSALAIGIAGWVAADVYDAIFQRGTAVVAYPSWADAGYLAMYPPLIVAVVLHLRAHRDRLSKLFGVDALIAALGVGAVSAAIGVEAILRTADDNDLAATLVNVAYPAGDMLVVSTVVGALVLTGWRLDGSFTRLAVGLAIGAAANPIYMLEKSTETYMVGSVLDAAWLVVALLFARSAWWRAAADAREPRLVAWRLVLTPALFAFLSLATIVVAYFERLNALAVVLAALSLVFVILRMLLTVREKLELLADTRRDALTDALTGLGNRRRLLEDLNASFVGLDAGSPRALVMFDLNGFKGYNDSFGHPAGDALLTRLGGRLHAFAVGHGGRAYRLGGDEFCVVVPAPAAAPEALAALAAEALRERGDGFAISAAHGAVLLPAEAQTPSAALATADRRMYRRKRGGRYPAAGACPVG
jgi:diguanylate cyclase (GGDEF)-like protein